MEKLTSLSHVNSTDDSEWKTKSRPKTNRKTKSPNSMNKASMDNESYTEYNKDQISLIKYYVTNRIKVLVLMRGPSGSGKSTLSKRLKPENQGMIISADNYFYNHASKTYVFDKNKLNDAHIDCRLKASNAMKNLISPIIIDNTNIKIWEFKPYVKLAVKHNYQIEIIEPSTPWKSNANMLFQKNIHRVEIHTIRRTISDYENVDLPKLINECQNEIKKEEDSKKPRAPSGILSNFDDIVKTNDWSTNESNLKLSSAFVSSNLILDKRLTDIQQNKPSFYLNESIANSKSTDITTTTDSEYFDFKSKDESLMNGLNKSEEEDDDEFKSFSLYESSSNSSDALTEELKDSLNVLKSMFPDIQDDIIIDFLIKYENDVNMVTNILLDSFNFSSTLSEPEKAPDLCKKNINEKEIVEDKKEALTVGRNFFQVKSLQELCQIEMEKLEMAMENLNSRIQQAKSAVFKPNSSSDSNSSSPVSSCKIPSEIYPRSNSVPKDFVNNHNGLCNGFKDNKKDLEKDDEPIIYLKIDKLKCLVDLFGTKDELENFNENCEIPIDLELAFKIYQSWKKTQKPSSKVQHKISSDYLNFDNQIENDEKLSMELFEATNMRDPIEKIPVFLSEKGINPAQLSLRQIMAEEMAEQRKEQMILNSFEKKSFENLTFFESIKFKKKINEKSSNQINALKNNINNGNQSENIANKIKLKDLYETYENMVDKKMIDDIFKKKNYNLAETTEYINEFFNIDQVKEINRVFDIKSTKITKRSISAGQLVNNRFNRFNSVEANYEEEEEEEYELSENGRDLASKYSNIRQSYFEKAAEAHSRGWGAVAQYYADMGHQQTQRIEDSNQKAAVQIFKENNPDFNHSNTLDLHGLHVKEAIDVLKKIITKRKLELSNPSNNNKKRKNYIFVITGYGHHSENGPRLRPNVINFLNQSSIRYKEVNVGLLQVYVLNN